MQRHPNRPWDLNELPRLTQLHTLQFNELATGRSATDYLWICPECDDGLTHAPMTWSGGVGFVHVSESASDWDDAKLHKLVAIDVLSALADLNALLESTQRQLQAATMREVRASR